MKKLKRGYTLIIFEILGKPVPQKQTQFFRGHAYDPSKKIKNMLQWQIASYAPKEPLSGPIILDIAFFFPIPASTSGVKRRQMLNGVLQHTIRPDIDNCAYLITNAMKKIIYNDDSQIVELYLHKRYGEIAKTCVKIVPYNYQALRGDSNEASV